MQTEKEMREAEVPTFETPMELNQYIDGLVFRDHDYGTCVYAMSMAAEADANFVATCDHIENLADQALAELTKEQTT